MTESTNNVNVYDSPIWDLVKEYKITSIIADGKGISINISRGVLSKRKRNIVLLEFNKLPAPADYSPGAFYASWYILTFVRGNKFFGTGTDYINLLYRLQEYDVWYELPSSRS